MDIYDLAIKKLGADRRPFNQLERDSGIPAETLRDIKRRIVKSPRFHTLKKLAKFYGTNGS